MRSKQQHFPFFILASFAVHAGILVALVFTSFSSQPQVQKSDVIEISFDEVTTLPVATEKKKIKLPEPKQVVESDVANANNQLSEKSRFLSDRSNTVVKETRAATGTQFKNIQAPNRAATAPTQAKAETQKDATKRTAEQKLFGDSFNAYKAVSQQQDVQQQKAAQRALASVGSTTNDNLEGLSDDLITRLNTREYKYAGYYHRIKEQLNSWWVPGVQEKFTKMMQQGRTIASEENKVTKLIIVLNPQGNLVNVQVLAESGVRDLDDAAVDAFRSAAPFPNPPKGMIDSDGTVKIRWDCVVES
ncbi:energy transducer TonB family protein [Pseudobdellovibrio exovorus]|uniref:Putative periplasmic protein TonB n=1 Tax=Pseudobdellovibrio exovorus JSS TaxID=1184267 RepID=M4VEH2_9BACT|nr:energy transducer TonB [Pseudobdellovibrio exovorus]AGH96431.1 putative periplasmic protein TonB [Pseudobdellovibrio exovorus JSS]